MSLYKTKILGIGVTTDSKKNILEEVQKYLKKQAADSLQRSAKEQKSFIIVTPNPEQVVLAQKDTRFREIINRADVAIPDGIGLVAAMRLLAQSSVISRQSSDLKRISGVELMDDLVKLAVKEGYRIGLIGGRGGVAVKALECLSRRWPGLRGWAMEPEGKTMKEISKMIAERDTRIVFVGLGAPKQEYFIERLVLSLRDPASWRGAANLITREIASSKTPRNDNVVFMSVGGAFDEISGRVPRPPKFIDAIGLKWLWRLLIEPWRFSRQLRLLKFVWLVLLEMTR